MSSSSFALRTGRFHAAVRALARSGAHSGGLLLLLRLART